MIGPAFRDPVLGAQSTFRAVLDATARPGTIAPLTEPPVAPPPLAAGAAAVALALCDHDTPLWLDPALRASPDVVEWLRFHTGARIADDTAVAAFAFVSAPLALPPLGRFSPGSDEYPDRSATVVLQVESFRHGPGLVLEGPGIRGRRGLQADPLPPDMPDRLADNARLFPRGVDLLLVAGADIVALPRSVRVTFEEA